MKEEIWKPIKGYEGYYEVSSHGTIRSVDRVVKKKNRGDSYSMVLLRGRNMQPGDNGHGYKFLYLKKNGTSKRVYVHRVVAEAFIHKIDGKDYINHIDGNKSNNIVDNLEWCTIRENNDHKMYVLKHFTSTKGKNNFKNMKKIGLFKEGVLVEVFNSLYEASDRLKMNYSNLSSICHGKRKSKLSVKCL